MQPPNHINWFKKIKNSLKTSDLKNVAQINFVYPPDSTMFSNFISYLRNHYCADEELDTLRKPTGLSRKDFLKTIKIPDQNHASIRASDFSEIIVSDYIQFILNYVIPRTRYKYKINKNTSPHGIDVLGFKTLDHNKINKNDELITCEVKASLRKKNIDTLQNAIKDSIKDFDIRKAESLNAIKQRLKGEGKNNIVIIIERFQNKTDKPYKEITGAAIVHSNETWENEIITNSSCENHPNVDNLLLLLIKGKNLMDLVNSLYERICDEA